MLFAPLERAWVRPACITHYARRVRLQDDGRIRWGDWDRPDRPLAAEWRYRCCVRHWVDGQGWEDTGALDLLAADIARSDLGEVDGCRTAGDIRQRYAALDALFAIMQAEGLPTRAARRRGRWVEPDPVRITIGRGGRVFAGHGGLHRIAMAHILGLERIPAGLSLVHPGAVPDLGRRRKPAARSLDWHIG